MYDSPIEVFINNLNEQMNIDFENNCIKTCLEYGINIKPEELKKALAYDRGQYNKGFKDGYDKATTDITEAIKNNNFLKDLGAF